MVPIVIGLAGNLATSTVAVKASWWTPTIWTGVVLLIVVALVSEFRSYRHDGNKEDNTSESDQFAEICRIYLDRLRERHRRVDLEILTPLTEQGEHPAMLLGQIFVPQSVRMDPPPMELPREVWRRLAADGHVEESDLPKQIDLARIEEVRRAFRERPPRPVLEALGDPSERKIVILGDPGAGKSTLSKYLMLTLAANRAKQDAHENSAMAQVPQAIAGRLPLLVELRTYADSHWRSKDFLDMLDYLHASEDLGLPKPLLEEFLRSDGHALVVFDGLDEIFDPKLRAEVAHQIDGFASRYPKTRIIVTSRVIGYSRGILDAAGFTHYMLQDLDSEQIKKFTTTWYVESCPGNPTEATRLGNRLLKAIDDSAAVAELAGNPLLLTILAIIGRRRELPRDRRTVYKHAVTVLIEHWDVNKHLRAEHIDGKAIDLDEEEKLRMLRLVARRMQGSPVGLAGNHIPAAELSEYLEQHLHDRFNLSEGEASKAARAILRQFRERNFILSLFGAEVYGFVHRAFLEYLAADDINQRFNDRDLNEEDLLQIFKTYWPDPAWSEVLLLLTGILPEQFAIQAIAILLNADPHWRIKKLPPLHLILALRATGEVRRTATLIDHTRTITEYLIKLLAAAAINESDYDLKLVGALQATLIRSSVGLDSDWFNREDYLSWYRSNSRYLRIRAYVTPEIAAQIYIALLPGDFHGLKVAILNDEYWAVRRAAVRAIASGWADHPGTLPLLRNRALNDERGDVREAAVRAIASGWADHPDTLPLLKNHALNNEHWNAREAAVQAIASGWADDPDTLPLLKNHALKDADEDVREAAVRAIASGWADHPDTLPLLKNHAINDEHGAVCRAAVQAIASGWADDPDTLPLLKNHALNNEHWNAREAAVQAIASGWADDPDTLPLLKNRALKDADEDVRRAAVQAIASGWADHPDTLPLLKNRALKDANEDVREAAVQAIASGWTNHPDTLPWLKNHALNNKHGNVRRAAVQAIASGWADDPNILPWLKDYAINNEHWNVRRAAVQAIASGWADDPNILPWLKDYAINDEHGDVREAAVQAIASGWADDPDTLPLLKNHALNNEHWNVRRAAVQAIASGWADHPDTLPLLKNHALKDEHWAVRAAAVQAIASGWADHPDTLPWLKNHALNNEHGNVRAAAVRAIASGWADHPDTLPLLKNHALKDEHGNVRAAAVRAIASGWADDPDTLPLLKNHALNDANEDVRAAAVRAIASGWADHPDTLPLLKNHALKDEHGDVRAAAVRAIASGWADHPDTLPLLKNHALNDANEDVRAAAVQVIASGWADHPDTLPLLKNHALNDEHGDVREAAVQAIASGWADHPDTLPLLKNHALNDEHWAVRAAAVRAIASGWTEDPDTLPLLKDHALTGTDRAEQLGSNG
ncbi:HEAT repeat domain-containing protein [Streptosporangium sp. 'caverna']|uniref:HEAT repeat domain-containing protein n=1 Tax=Streptosporangium sp. 'caverna' TaxID=2202249 RepID=UPI0013A69922|nr:HEAT repeat domain-containing protein [Streptosporangium sp. 'caverna']